MIVIRDDDVLWDRRNHKFAPLTEVERFKQVHEWLCQSDQVLHVPAILVKQIQEYPEGIEYIKKRTYEGYMKPQLHGWDHSDYSTMDLDLIRGHLFKCFEWFYEVNLPMPSKLYATFGNTSKSMKKVASEFGLEMVGLDKKKTSLMRICKEKRDLTPYENGEEIFMHWWQCRDFPLQLVNRLETGSWEPAPTIDTP